MHKLILTIARCSLMFLVPSIMYANSGQWDLDPISGDWNTAANWTPMGVPNGPADIATFALSHNTNVSISANTEVNGITFYLGRYESLFDQHRPALHADHQWLGHNEQFRDHTEFLYWYHRRGRTNPFH